ncbi:MAG: hypothetical protein RQ862_02275 [Candidatus Caldarchaeales archaeon]|nr:hypothetical protein [Candidatus Caldarchaeales archaeon]
MRSPLYKLKRPIPVYIDYEDDCVIAANEELGIFTCGASVDEAVEEFRRALLDDYETYLRFSSEELSEGALELIRKLQELIVKVTVSNCTCSEGEGIWVEVNVS